MPSAKRTPYKGPVQQVSRTPVQIPQTENEINKLFANIAPGGLNLSNLSNIPQSISDDEVKALTSSNFALWASTSNIKVDHRPFDFGAHRYLLPIYLDQTKEIIMMKAAQMGATIWVLLRLLHFCMHNPVKACLFFPTQDGVTLLSKDRMTPLIDSNAELKEAVKDSDTLGYKQVGKESALYLRHLGGVASKDSTPFDMLAFDEVRLLNAADIDQARERVSHSTYKTILQVSTAGLPNCFAGNTEVLVRDKQTLKVMSVTIASLVETYNQYEALSFNKWREITGAVCRGMRSMVEVKLLSGQKIKCTKDHRFATIGNEHGPLWLPIFSIWQHKLPIIGSALGGVPMFNELFVGSVSVVEEELAYDLEIEETPWFVLAESGCLVHNSDIHKQFLRGTQNFWHSYCGCKPDGIVLSEVFPDCIAISPKKEVYYRCPRCKMKIVDPQNGRYIAHNPGASIQSYHIHQMLSKYISAAEIWEAFQITQNLKEFFNAKLGKPYVDEVNIPVTDDDLMACENSDIMWDQGKAHTAMGVDQMSGILYVVIAQRLGNKKRIVHYEIVDDLNPIYHEAGNRQPVFKRLYQLMKEFDVDLCIVDAMPNANEAMEFARAFPKRVFVAWYLEQQREVVQWGDRPKYKVGTKKGGPKIKFKYSVLISRYLSIEMAMKEIADRNVEWPNPRSLVQICRNQKTGRYEPMHIFEAYFYLHMKSIVRQKTILDENTGRFKMEWLNLGLDPHSCHSMNYCNLAMERLRKQPMFTLA